MKTIKVGRFATLQFGHETCSHGSSASSVNNKEENKMFNHKEMSQDAQIQNKEENKMKQTLKEKRRFFKEVASMAREACKAGWNGEEFDIDEFIEEKGFDTLLTKEEQEAKAAKDASKAERERKIKELHDFYSSLGEPSEPKEVEVEAPPAKEEEESTTVEETPVDETPVDETVQEKEEAPEVTEETEVTEEETPEVSKVRPIAMKIGKLFNHVGKFGAEGIRKVKGGYQWAVEGMIDTLKGGEKMGRLDSYDYYNGEETLFAVILINDSTSEDLFDIPMADVISYQLSDGFITIVTLDTVYTVSKAGEVHTSSC